MPIFTNTPEARLGRNDSKNPSTTCRGITSSGRPCRRPNSLPQGGKVKVSDPTDERLYCHQHKDQARLAAHSAPGPVRPTHGAIAEERSSLDTLAERLGLMKTNSAQVRPSAQYQRPPRPAQQKKSSSLWCCCFSIPLDLELEEQAPPPRPQAKPVQHHGSSRPSHLAPNGVSPRPSSSSQRPPAGSNVSQTAQFMSLIPHSASPETASLLMKELAKGFSAGDEAGYIYIFWLTPESDPATPPHEAAKALLTTNPRSRSTSRGRAASDALDRYATSYDDEPRSRGRGGAGGGAQKKNKKILLKIGRANNVQRRLNEWQRQCGYNISLIRYYPYVSSSSTSDVMRKMPHSHKVERLIHIELQGRGLRVMDRGKCPSCGKEHKEWFEVDNTRAAVADIDEVVRRWSDWDETQA
ncbi:hypothetical protein SMACR_03913 [Sordaria macrospora]|uniref:WGS project CABT00000000 data, contig 2.17 n=2 Tax=Sordaria macrospora TaxID=5147 RepID=F7W0A7_SORMK|nr:uncharacterized protein SMAC_03913 [Sordaria macrospora k-hell]KAA8634960.1 hypothetical protein SMACR_03913 [Sordaria macrospora]KAH7633244.1 meiotically up-regulated gene 113-domain-containing protein [Sordaria sp. MPI-SDFR-AT-0083]WPJ60349.1 hypothetical protein SMAC4_03913 [Sordaria macrospora]CCC11207.1 unnamed protein product [Sordaria macrospora k-hell]